MPVRSGALSCGLNAVSIEGTVLYNYFTTILDINSGTEGCVGGSNVLLEFNAVEKCTASFYADCASTAGPKPTAVDGSVVLEAAAVHGKN